MEEEEGVDNSKEEDKEEAKDNSVDIDGEKVDIEALKNLHREIKKNNAKEESKDNSETKDNSVDIDEIQHKALISSMVTETSFTPFIDGKSLFGSKHKK